MNLRDERLEGFIRKIFDKPGGKLLHAGVTTVKAAQVAQRVVCAMKRPGARVAF